MPIVTLSRGSYTRGREVAEKLAERMNYELISREALLEASEQFNIPEIKLERALYDPPSTLQRFFSGKQRYLAYMRHAILKHMVKDNTIYHGLAGHAFLPKVVHLLRVRIRADMEVRVKEEAKRENISEEEARYFLSKDDEERRKWSVFVTGYDPFDPSQYDIIFNASVIPIDNIVDLIEQLLQKSYLQATPESQKVIEELAKAAEIKAALVEAFPEAEVKFSNGIAIVSVEGTIHQEEALAEKVRNEIKDVQGVEEIRVNAITQTFFHKAD